jgi:peptidoglycan/xylan/chitin deacetylase (PgdA/CDA1 family)
MPISESIHANDRTATIALTVAVTIALFGWVLLIVTVQTGSPTPDSIAHSSGPPLGLSVDVPILQYHKVADTPSACSSLWVTKRVFDQQMAALSAYGYSTISLQDFVDYRNGVGVPPPHPIILTFDDGYENFYTDARPVLNQYGFKATDFLPTDYIGVVQRQNNAWDPPEARCPADMLLWSEAATMLAEGYSFGAHTRSHPHSRALDSLTRVEDEIEGSRAEIQSRLGAAPAFFAYPFGEGARSPTLRLQVKKAGYLAALSTQAGVANTLHSDIWALPRIKIIEAHAVKLDPTTPASFFMRQVDPQFPVPDIVFDRAEIVDQEGRTDRTTIHPGETLTIALWIRNVGTPVNVVGSLRIAPNSSQPTAPLYDSHRTSPRRDAHRTSFGADDIRPFVYEWTVPETAPAGSYRLDFTVRDEYGVLIYFSSTTQAVAPLSVRPPETAPAYRGEAPKSQSSPSVT